NVVQISCGSDHTLALTSDGRVYAWGSNDWGQIGEEKKQKVMKEVKSLAKLDSDFVVKYYNSWLESNHLFIQMEFCLQSLKSVLKDKPIVFERQPEDHMNSNVLNIFMNPIRRSNRCVKLCDFGLATEHDPQLHTESRYKHSSVGTFGYIAPEVLSGKPYSHKSDIFSLHAIGEQLFAIDFQASQSFEAKESVFKTSILCMYEILQQMMAIMWRQRPECRQVLAKYNEWSIDKSIIINNVEFNSELDKLKSIHNP
ncbi:unnamed protein product, partial [Medioppia subpectinata]